MSIYLNTRSLPSTCSYQNCVNHNSANMKCSRCKSAIYCGQICQKADWPAHKKVCKVSSEPKNNIQTTSAHSFDTSTVVENAKQTLSNSNFTIMVGASHRESIGEFSKEDLDVLGYEEKEIQAINTICKSRSNRDWLSKVNLPCFDYALLAVKERGVREQMFTPIVNRSFKEVMDERLQRWGYELKESPQEGDLVVYYNQKTYTHMGIYLNNGLIKSKPGSASNYVIMHSIGDVAKYYGDQVFFFRKNPHAIPVYREDHMIRLVPQK